MQPCVCLLDKRRAFIFLTGGDRQTLVAANHTVQNSTISSFSRLLQKYTPGVCLCGVGNNLIDSIVSDGPHFGMLLTGNDHTIEGNHFHTLVQSGADAGAIYSGRDWTYRGQMIKSNLFENITSYLCLPGAGCSNCLGQPPRALHSDDGMSGWTVIGNTFVNCTKVHNAYSSRDITFTDNYIAHINLSEVAHNQHSATQLDVMRASCAEPSSTQYKFPHRVPYNTAPYTKYPHLAEILSDEPCLPKYWNLTNNIYCDISSHTFGDSPLIGGNYNPATFGVSSGNVNSSVCSKRKGIAFGAQSV